MPERRIMVSWIWHPRCANCRRAARPRKMASATRCGSPAGVMACLKRILPSAFTTRLISSSVRRRSGVRSTITRSTEPACSGIASARARISRAIGRSARIPEPWRRWFRFQATGCRPSPPISSTRPAAGTIPSGSSNSSCTESSTAPKIMKLGPCLGYTFNGMDREGETGEGPAFTRYPSGTLRARVCGAKPARRRTPATRGRRWVAREPGRPCR